MAGVKVKPINIAPLMKGTAHGRHDPKTLMVLHETVSPDVKGLSDMTGVEKYLKSVGYGIHGMTDEEGHLAWALNWGDAIFYQCGGVNTQSCGIEQVSPIPSQLAAKKITVAKAQALWAAREDQLHATAKLIACWHAVDPKNRPVKHVDGTGRAKGITSHYEVSQHFAASEGHTDCHPVHLGGYYPILEVVDFAKTYVSLGYHF